MNILTIIFRSGGVTGTRAGAVYRAVVAILLVLAGLGLGAAPAHAEFVLVPAGKAFTLPKTRMTVTPNIDWNRHVEQVGPVTSSWTQDGLALNDVSFFAGVLNGQPLVVLPEKEKDTPLPRFESTMLPTDVAQLFESTYRVAVGSTNFSIDTIEPANFADQSGFRFTYSFVVQGEEVRRKGEANGVVVGGRLFMISFDAPALHYFDRVLPAYRAIVDSATLDLTSPAKPRPERKP